MLVLPLRQLVEEASSTGKNLSGAIRSFDFLEQESALSSLEAAHPGCFSYLAFHPSADVPVAEYVKAGTLSGDSGPKNLVLFSLDAEANAGLPADRFPREIIDVDYAIHTSYRAVRVLFEPKPPPPLPGVAVFRRFTGENDVIYAHLDESADLEAVRQRLRAVFAKAEVALVKADNKNRDFADELAVQLEGAGLPFTRTGGVAVRQWLIRVYRFTEEHAGDIVAAVGLLAP